MFRLLTLFTYLFARKRPHSPTFHLVRSSVARYALRYVSQSSRDQSDYRIPPQIIDDVTGGKFRILPREKSGIAQTPRGARATPNRIRAKHPSKFGRRRRKIVVRVAGRVAHRARRRRLLNFDVGRRRVNAKVTREEAIRLRGEFRLTAPHYTQTCTDRK